MTKTIFKTTYKTTTDSKSISSVCACASIRAYSDTYSTRETSTRETSDSKNLLREKLRFKN